MQHALPSLLALACCLPFTTNPTLAGDAPPDKSAYGIFNPTPDGALRAFSPDRPLNSISPTTVDAGRLQVESDFALLTQTSDRLTTTRTLQALDPEIRLGLTRYLEVDLLASGLNADRVTTKDTGRTLERDTGTGNTMLRARYGLFGDEGGTYALALAPFISVPSGDAHFGSQGIEGGVIVPLSIALPSDFKLVLQTEVQALHDDAGAAYASFTNIANLSHVVPGIDQLTASVEFTSTVNADRSTADVHTFEAALAYLATPDTQLDLGGFVGLNHAAPDYQIAAGISHRF